jgi:hypothetical protein
VGRGSAHRGKPTHEESAMDIIADHPNTEQKDLKKLMLDFAAAILLDLADFKHPAGSILEAGGMRVEVLSETPYRIKVNFRGVEKTYIKR